MFNDTPQVSVNIIGTEKYAHRLQLTTVWISDILLQKINTILF